MSQGIPTYYSGIRFRSRLEATWAAFFDLMQWPWEYEPFDLDGYIPDFALPNPLAENGVERQVVVDIKPVSDWKSLCGRAKDLRVCGWAGDIVVAGQCPLEQPKTRETEKVAMCLGHNLFYLPDDPMRVKDDTSMLRVYENSESCRRYVDEYGWWASPVTIMKCERCARIFYELDGGYSCPFCLHDFYEPSIRRSFVTIADVGTVRAAFTAAKNRAQWRGEFGG